jgi:hypothetical protein
VTLHVDDNQCKGQQHAGGNRKQTQEHNQIFCVLTGIDRPVIPRRAKQDGSRQGHDA